MSLLSIIVDIIEAFLLPGTSSPAKKLIIQQGLQLAKESEQRKEEMKRLAELPPITGTITFYIEKPKDDPRPDRHKNRNGKK